MDNKKVVKKQHAVDYIADAENILVKVMRWLGLFVEIVRFGRGKINEELK